MNERENVIVSTRGLRKEYGSGESLVRAVDEVAPGWGPDRWGACC